MGERPGGHGVTGCISHGAISKFGMLSSDPRTQVSSCFSGIRPRGRTSRSKTWALVILRDAANFPSSPHCVKASVMDKTCSCSGWGVREPVFLLSGERTRACSGSWENKARFGSPATTWPSGKYQSHSLANLRNLGGGVICTLGAETGPSESLRKGTKQKERHCAGQDSGIPGGHQATV